MSDAKDVTRPLAGRRVAVTRASAQAGPLIRLLEQSGAEVMHIPAIEVVPPASWDSLDRVIDTDYDWLVFTSVNGVQSFFSRMHLRAKHYASLQRSRIAAVGRVTADELQLFGITADVVPERAYVDALIAVLPEKQTGVRTAIIRAEEGRSELVDELQRRGGTVDLAIAYRTIPAAIDVDALRTSIAADAIDAVTFTSPSTVEYFFAPLDPADCDRLTSRAAMIAIGPTTSEALRKLRGVRLFEARKSDVEGLHDAVVEALA